MVSDFVAGACLLAGALFFTAGTVGLLRFPDIRSQLHALTKADNLGLGLIFTGIAVHVASWKVAFVLALVWLLALMAASVSARVLAGTVAAEETRGDP